ncbi:MAG TPA: AAA family ATPase, partial [Reyranella sp.]|nr:AAA family ATPase [Reyranella sp.]
MRGVVIFLSGPVGVGKTVLGRLAAAKLEASFIDSDDLGDPSKRWFEQGLSAANALVTAVKAA